MQEKRICILMDSFYTQRIGGAEVQAYILAIELIKRGWEVHYIAENRKNNYVGEENIEGIKVHWLKYRKYFQFLNSVSLFLLLKKINAPFIYQRYYSFYTGIAGLYSFLFGKKYIWFCTDFFAAHRFVSIRRQLFNFKIAKIPWYKKIYNLGIALLNDISKEFGTKFVNLGLALSEEERKLIETNFNIKKTDIIRIGHKIEMASRGKSVTKKNIIWVGNMGAGKWPEGFIMIARHFADSPYEFWLIGDHPKNERKKEVLSLASGLKNFRYIEGCKFNDTHQYYDQAFLLVNTTRIPGGGIGNSNAQALVRGIPIISITVDPENIIKKYNVGVLSGSIEKAVEDIRLLMNDKNKYRELSENAFNCAEQNLSKEKMVDKFEKLICSL